MSESMKGWKRSIDEFPSEIIERFLVGFIPHYEDRSKFEDDSFIGVGVLSSIEDTDYRESYSRVLINTPMGYQELNRNNLFRDTENLLEVEEFFYWKELDEDE